MPDSCHLHPTMPGPPQPVTDPVQVHSLHGQLALRAAPVGSIPPTGAWRELGCKLEAAGGVAELPTGSSEPASRARLPF